MSPHQTAVYLTRMRDRIAAIRENTNANASSIKTKISNTVRRDSLGRQGESARQVIGAFLGEYYDESQKSDDDLRDLSPVEEHWHGWDGDGDDDGEEQDWDVRLDSMSPLRDGEGEEIVDSDEKREDWELDMDREHERRMEVDRGMSLESLIAEERFVNGEIEGEMYVAYHSMNSRAMRKMRLDEVERMYRSGGRYSTISKKTGREIQNLLQEYSEEAPNAGRQEDEDGHVSHPYPDDDDYIPLTRQPNHGSLPNFNDPNKADAKRSSELSILTNPYPEDAPATSRQPPPPTQSPYSTTPSSAPERFPIYPSDRTISPIIPFIASRHVASPVSPRSTRGYQRDNPAERANTRNSNVEDYASSHPYHGMNEQGIWEYWHDLQGYNTESKRHLRLGEVPRNGRQRAVSSPVQYRDERILGPAGEDYEPYIGSETGGGQREQAGGKKVNMVGRFLGTFTCRPGAVSPEDAAVPVENDEVAGMVSIVPRKYAMAFLSRKMGRTQRKEEDARLRERLLALQLSEPNEKTMRRIEHTRRAIEVAQEDSRARKRDEGTRRRPKPRFVNVESQTHSVLGPPVDLSRMIQRAPESIRTPSPLPQSDAVPLGIGENVERVPRQAHSDSSSSLSDRLRQTKLEDLPLRSGAAEEIRNLMLDLERDQNEPNTTPVQHGDGLQSDPTPTTTPTRQANELPGGFIQSEIPTNTLLKPNIPSLSPRETLQRHFNTQRQANKQYAQRVRAAKSHSSNLTLPPSFRAPEMHSSMLSIPREPSPLAQVASVEDIWGMSLGEEEDAERRYARTEGLEEEREEDT